MVPRGGIEMCTYDIDLAGCYRGRVVKYQHQQKSAMEWFDSRQPVTTM